MFCTASSKNSAGRTLLISSDYALKISRAPFNSLRFDGNKGHTYLSKPVITSIKGLKNTTG